jgi:hypothetical protein
MKGVILESEERCALHSGPSTWLRKDVIGEGFSDHVEYGDVTFIQNFGGETSNWRTCSLQDASSFFPLGVPLALVWRTLTDLHVTAQLTVIHTPHYLHFSQRKWQRGLIIVFITPPAGLFVLITIDPWTPEHYEVLSVTQDLFYISDIRGLCVRACARARVCVCVCGSSYNPFARRCQVRCGAGILNILQTEDQIHLLDDSRPVDCCYGHAFCFLWGTDWIELLFRRASASKG